jgi:hypothetical protein
VAEIEIPSLVKVSGVKSDLDSLLYQAIHVKGDYRMMKVNVTIS